jgi:hypothetical protein
MTLCQVNNPAHDRPGRDRSEVRPGAAPAASPSARRSAGRRPPAPARRSHWRLLASAARGRRAPRSPFRARASAARATVQGLWGVRLTPGTAPILRLTKTEAEARRKDRRTCSKSGFGSCSGCIGCVAATRMSAARSNSLPPPNFLLVAFIVVETSYTLGGGHHRTRAGSGLALPFSPRRRCRCSHSPNVESCGDASMFVKSSAAGFRGAGRGFGRGSV